MNKNKIEIIIDAIRHWEHIVKVLIDNKGEHIIESFDIDRGYDIYRIYSTEHDTVVLIGLLSMLRYSSCDLCSNFFCNPSTHWFNQCPIVETYGDPCYKDGQPWAMINKHISFAKLIDDELIILAKNMLAHFEGLLQKGDSHVQ